MSSNGRPRATAATKLEAVVAELALLEQAMQGEPSRRRPDARARLAVTLLYLVVMLSLPPIRLLPLLALAAYPVLLSHLSGVGYAYVLRRSLPALPFVIMVGVFNPIIDRTAAISLFGVDISRGWLSFISIMLRGLLAVQAVLLLLIGSGFGGVCSALRGVGLPPMMIGQLQMLYRHLTMLLTEALGMSRAVAVRGYGRRAYPPRLWATFIGCLLLRSIDRAERVERAMLARGFSGCLPLGQLQPWRRADTLYVAAFAAAFLLVRFCL
jgi:cobalt/nickel transport system permease protein